MSTRVTRDLVLVLVATLASCSRAPRPTPGAVETPSAPTDTASEAAPEPAQAPAEPSEPRPPRTIYRSELRRATGRGPGYLLEQLGPESYRPDGRFQGWRITRLFPDDPELCAARCDLSIGDIIITVNGNNLERPEQLSRLFEQLPGLTELRVRSVRDGIARKASYAIADDPG
jgi:type II secretory pathway component PulC